MSKNNLNVHIPAHIYEEIDYYVQSTQEEISGLGRIVKDGDTLRVTKIYLPKQENTGATTDLDQDDVSSLLYTSREDEGEMTFWWHSHNSMPAFWSGTDDATIQDLGKNGYIVATVFNHKREFKTAYFQAETDFLPPVLIDDVPTSFGAVVSAESIAQYDKNIAENVVEKVYIWPKAKKTKKGKGWKATRTDADKYDYMDGAWESGKEWCGIGQRWDWPEVLEQEKETLLGKSGDTLACITDFQTAVAWEDLYIEYDDLAPHDVTDKGLIRFYNAYEGDYQSAMTALMMEYENREDAKEQVV